MQSILSFNQHNREIVFRIMSSIIKTIYSLNQLLIKHKLNYMMPKDGNIALRFKELSEKETIYWSTKLNYYCNYCGCSQGAFAIILTMTSFVIYIVFIKEDIKITLFTCIQALSLFIISGAVGKTIGLIFGKLYFKKYIKELIILLLERRKIKTN